MTGNPAPGYVGWNLFEAAADRLTGRFVPHPAEQTADTTTLSRALYDVLGIAPGAGTIAYIEWRQLRPIIAAAFTTLDDVASLNQERPRSGMAWSAEADRTEADVIALLHGALQERPELKVEFEPRLRPGANPKRLGTVKRRGVMCGALANLHATTTPTVTVGELVALLSQGDLTTVDDYDLLTRIDDRTDFSRAAEPDPIFVDLKERFDDPWGDHRFGEYLVAVFGDNPAGDGSAALSERIASAPAPLQLVSFGD